MEKRPGSAMASLITSARLLAGNDAVATRMNGDSAARLTIARSLAGSYIRLVRSPMLTPNAPAPAIPKVRPSGAALATASTPSMPPAPARFSTTTGWPRIFSSAGCMARATASVLPPAGNGTKKRSGLSGHGCAQEGPGETTPEITPASAITALRHRAPFHIVQSLQAGVHDSRAADLTVAQGMGRKSCQGQGFLLDWGRRF